MLVTRQSPLVRYRNNQPLFRDMVPQASVATVAQVQEANAAPEFTRHQFLPRQHAPLGKQPLLSNCALHKRTTNRKIQTCSPHQTTPTHPLLLLAKCLKQARSEIGGAPVALSNRCILALGVHPLLSVEARCARLLTSGLLLGLVISRQADLGNVDMV